MNTRALMSTAVVAAALAMHAPTASAFTFPNIHAFAPCGFGAMSSGGGCGGSGGKTAQPNQSVYNTFGNLRIINSNRHASGPSNSGGIASRALPAARTQPSGASAGSTPNGTVGVVPLPLPAVLLGTALLGLGFAARRKST